MVVHVACLVGPGDGSLAARMRSSVEGVAEKVVTSKPSAAQMEARGFGSLLTALVKRASRDADWVLRLDSDMVVEVHEGLIDWLAEDPDPDVAAWDVLVREDWGTYRLPLLMRASLPWKYVGATHEYLDTSGRKTRPLVGLTVNHLCDGATRPQKHERDLALLQAGYDERDPRAVFYFAQALRGLGRVEEAIEAYRLRAVLGGWEEERWYAQYQAAALSRNITALIDAYRARPHRHEPLTAAARLVASASHSDSLFNDNAPR